MIVMVTAYATLSAGTEHLSLSAREGRASGTWRYNFSHGTNSRVAYGHVAGITDRIDVLRYAAGICAAGYEPGTAARGMLEQFSADHTGIQPTELGETPQ